MIRYLQLSLLRWRMRALADRVNWSVQHIASHRREIAALQDDIAYRERLIEKCERERTMLGSRAWALEAPGGLIKS